MFWIPAIALAQVEGVSPESVHPIDIFSSFQLPAFPDSPDSEPGTTFASLQVGIRARNLKLSSASPTAAWQTAQSLLNRRRLLPAFPASALVFSGSTASALNQFVSGTQATYIRVDAPTLNVDVPISVRRQNVTLDLGSAVLSGSSPVYMLRIENTASVRVTGGFFVSGKSAVLVANSSDVTVAHLSINSLSGAGIVVTGSTRVTLDGNSMSNLTLAGIVLHHGASFSVVEHNNISNGQGFSNMTAGIVMTHREADLASDPRNIFGPDGYGVIIQRIDTLMKPPADNLIAWNSVTNDLSSGIYVDGAIRSTIYSNRIEGNSKEGLCLDNGASGNVVLSNIVHDNGKRWGDPDSILALDFVIDGGRLADGAAAEKVPGISLDNAAYNIVMSNDLAHNFGGGVKLVRTDYFNAIGLNNIYSDNDGAGPVFHFFGIEFGGASGNAPDLDYTGSRGNIAFSNTIRGSHYSGIFFSAGSDFNDVRGNSIFDATAWALESLPGMKNYSVNNLTDLRSRNISSGLSPSIISSGQAVNDTPQ